MTPNQILRNVRREREMSQEQMADLLGLTRARLNQYELRDSIPPERIKDWSNNGRLPDWVKNMAYQMWLASLEQQHAAINEQIQELGTLIRDC